jgi:hypothetical protein
MANQETHSFTMYKVNLRPTKWDKKINMTDVTKLKIYVNSNDCFEARNLNIFTNYTLTFFSADPISKWLSKCDLSFYQNQLNFAVWCASAGCGMSVEHLTSAHRLLSSVFRFHLYYQTRKILEEMNCPIPGDPIFNATDNHINLLKYQKLCNEFNVSPTADFRFKGGENNGLGTMYNYVSRLGYRPVRLGPYNPNRFQFIDQSRDGVIKIDYVKQDAAMEGWKQFIPDTSRGFTRAGAVRLDDSIRNYVHCILGAQAQTRSNILKSLETQQYFVDLLEQNIKSMFSIPESIAEYQEAITKTNSRIDYAIAVGLYMIPSDLVLKADTLIGYNNSIVIATADMKIGQNDDLNTDSFALSHSSTPAAAALLPTAAAATAANARPTNIDPTYVGIGISLIAVLLFYAAS